MSNPDEQDQALFDVIASNGGLAELASKREIIHQLKLMAEAISVPTPCLGYILHRCEQLEYVLRSTIEERHDSPSGCKVHGSMRCARSSFCLDIIKNKQSKNAA